MLREHETHEGTYGTEDGGLATDAMEGGDLVDGEDPQGIRIVVIGKRDEAADLICGDIYYIFSGRYW